jgi:hypothetical protein
MTDDVRALTHLDVARHIEKTVALCRSLRGHLEHGPFERTRGKVRRQLDKLVDVLDQVQLAALAGPLAPDADAVLREALTAIGPQLERVLWHVLDKRALKHLRRELKRVRHALAATAPLATAA